MKRCMNIFDGNQVEKENIMKIIHAKEEKQLKEGKKAQETDLSFRKKNNVKVGKNDTLENVTKMRIDIEKKKIKECHKETDNKKSNDIVRDEKCTIVDDDIPINAYDQFVQYENTYPKTSEQPAKIFAQLKIL